MRMEESSDEKLYMRSLMFPFLTSEDGSRVPRIAGVPTKTYQHKGHFNFQANAADALIICQHHFIRGPHIVVIRPPAGGSLDTMLKTSTYSSTNYSYLDPVSGETLKTTETITALHSGLTI